MKLLLINANTSPDITELVVREAQACAAPGTAIAGATGRFGGRYIASRAAYAIAGHAALEAYAEHGADADAVLLACFGDPGLAALKELASVPVVGMAEAACHQAAQFGRRFAIVTGGERWGAMLEELVAGFGLTQRLCAVETVAPSGAEIAADPAGALALLAAACRAAVARGAEAVILGGAGLAGLAPRLAPDVPVPLIDGLVAAVKAAEAAIAQHVRKPCSGSLAATPPVASVGLAPALAARLAGLTA